MLDHILNLNFLHCKCTIHITEMKSFCSLFKLSGSQVQGSGFNSDESIIFQYTQQVE